MAQIIPEDSLTNSHPGPQLHYCLRQLDDAIITRQQFMTDSTIGPCYWVNRGKQSLLLMTLPEQSINHDSALDAEQLANHSLINNLSAHRDSLLPTSLKHHAYQLLPIVLLLQDDLGTKQTVYLKELGLLAIGGVLMNGAMPLV
ncbi:MAG: hypothetical protein ACPG47_11130, partial [Leucothrix sp.]